MSPQQKAIFHAPNDTSLKDAFQRPFAASRLRVTAPNLKADGYTPPEAWRLLKTRHPNAYPHPILLQSLLDCYRVPLTVAELYTLKLESIQEAG